MESKAFNLMSLFSKYNSIKRDLDNVLSEIENVQQDKKSLEKDREEYNYSNDDLIIKNINNYIDEKIKEKGDIVRYLIDNQIDQFEILKEDIENSYTKISSWMSESTIDECLRNADLKIFDRNDDIILNKCNNVINRKGSFENLLYILLFIAGGPGFIVYGICEFISQIISLGFIGTIASIIIGIYVFIQWLGFIKGFVLGSGILLSIIVIIVVSLVIFIINQITLSKNYFVKDIDKYYYYLRNDTYKIDLRNKVMDSFLQNEVKNWNDEISLIKEGKESELKNEIINSLKKEYDLYTVRINETNDILNRLNNDSEEINNKLDEVDKEIIEAEKYVFQPIVEGIEYNDGVLTNTIAFEREGKGSIVIRHDYNPIVFKYTKADYDPDELKIKVAKLVDKIYEGFICDNSKSIIDFNIIDLETGGATFGSNIYKQFYKIIHNPDSLFKKLKDISSIIYENNGDIESENISRTKVGDNPIKYTIVIHFGKKCLNISQEHYRIYNANKRIGFIPIFILDDDVLNQAITRSNDFNEILEKSNTYHMDEYF